MSRRSMKAGLAVGALSCAAAIACQPYNMEGVNPQTIVAVETSRTFVGSKPPVLLIVQDRSGSMEICFGNETAQQGENGCSTGPTTRDPNRRSRMQIAQEVMREALGRHLDDAFYGLVIYGVGETASCGDAELTVPVNTLEAPRTTAELVQQAYSSNPNITDPNGGTPSTASLAQAYAALVTQDGELRFADRANYVVLITDGLMNCNESFSGNCVCSQENGCAGSQFGEVMNPTPTQRPFCLDDVAATQQVNLLASKNIKTFVIGLGESFGDNPLAVTTLNTLSNAGGAPRVPPADDPAQRTFYPADDKVALQQSINGIIDSITAPCEYELDGPVCEGRLVAINLSIDGTPVATTCNEAFADPTVTNAWYFTDLTAQKITFSQDICSALRVATQVDVSIRGVETACPSNPDGSTVAPACKLGQ